MTEDIAQFAFAARGHDIDTLAARSAELWAGLALDHEAHASLRRDGLDPTPLRLSGPHPFVYEPALDWAVAVSARASDRDAAEALLDLFRVYFLRRLLV